MRKSILILVLSVFMFCLSSILVSAALPFNCTYGNNYSGSGDWVITTSTYCKDVPSPMELGDNDDLILSSTLVLDNCDLKINPSSAASSKIWIRSGGSLYLNATTTITRGSGTSYNYYVNASDSNTLIDIRNAGMSSYGDGWTTPKSGMYTNGTIYVDGGTFSNCIYCIILGDGAHATVKNSVFTNGGRGVTGDGPAANITDNTFNFMTRTGGIFNAGIMYSGSYGNILRNRVYNSTYALISIGAPGSYNNIINNSLDGTFNATYGFSVGNGCLNNYFYGNNVSNMYNPNAACILMDGASNNVFERINMSHCGSYGAVQADVSGASGTNYILNSLIGGGTGYGVAASTAGTLIVQDTPVSGTVSDFFLLNAYGSPATVIALNSTYDSSTVTDGTLWKKWYLSVFVNDSTNNPVQNVNVIDYAANGTAYQFSTYTGANGYTLNQNVTETEETSGGIVGYNDQNISISKPGYNTVSNRQVTVTGNTQFPITITGSGVVPEFSSYLMMAITLGAVLSGIVVIRKKR